MGMKDTLRKVWIEARRHLGNTSRLLLSHHPICSHFRSDMVRIGNVYLCKGCLIGYSTALVAILSYLLIPGVSSLPVVNDSLTAIVVGSVLGSLQFIRALFPGTPSIIKYIQKFFLGIGISLLVIGIFTLEIGVGWSIMILWICFLLYGLLGIWLRPRYIRKVCMECEYKGDWENCEAFSDLYDKYKNEK